MKTLLLVFSLCIFHSYTQNQHSVTKQIISEMSWGLKTYYFNNIAKLKSPRRRVDIQYLKAQSRRQNPDNFDDDDKMKTKIFRLMYEMIREAEMNMRRAEAMSKIKDDPTGLGHYVKIGYLRGNAEDRQKVLINIAVTLKKRYDDWKAIEHVNAYEQALNLAIEIDNLIIAHDDHLKVAAKVIEEVNLLRGQVYLGVAKYSQFVNTLKNKNMSNLPEYSQHQKEMENYEKKYKKLFTRQRP